LNDYLIFLYCSRNDFKGYSLQSRLHFRIHAAQNDLKKLSRSLSSQGPSPDDVSVNTVMPISNESHNCWNKFDGGQMSEEDAMKILEGR